MKTTLSQFFQFSAVGLISFLVDVVAMWCLAGAMPIMWARTLAFLLATLTNWLFHRQYTFKEHATPDAKFKEAIHFLVASLIGILPNIGVYWLTVESALYQSYAQYHLAPVIAMIPGVLAGHICNFLLSKFWVFKPKF